MASSSAVDLVSRAKKFREVDAVAHDSVPNVQETLSTFSKFLQEHETPSANDCTHTVFDNFQDWWMGSKPNYKLAIAEDNTLDTFYKCISVLYDLGIPLTLTERRTPEIRFLQDLEIWGTKDTTLRLEELIDVQSKFALLLGKAMGEVYPEQKFLDVVVFDASGVSRTKGVMKTSVRLVWSNLVVDKDRAARIRDYVVHKFKDSKNEDIVALEQKMLALNKDNSWPSVLGDAIYFGRFGIRMPLCDRVSPAPLKKPEQRAFSPVGVFRFTYDEGEVKDMEKICSKNELDGVEWLKIGCIRRDAGTPLTEWTLPTWKGERAARTLNTQSPLNASGALLSRTPGQVKVRTRQGSDNGTVRAIRRDPQKTDRERLVTVEREFEGTLDEFREKLETQLGKKEEGITVKEGTLVWKCDDTGARIEFKAANHRVYLVGKAHQIRTLLNTIASFAKAVGGDAARSATQTARSANSHRAGSEYGGASYAPSAVYAPPSVVHAPSTAGAYPASTASRASNGREGGQASEPSKRIAIRDFVPQSQGELALKVNDHVTVTHDPEECQHNVHRWVYGLNETTQNRGWFPNSYVKPLQITESTVELPPEQ